MANNKCNVETCDLFAQKLGLCSGHYNRLRRYGTPEGEPVLRRKRGIEPCGVDGCDRPYYAKGYCNTHYLRARKNEGDPMADVPVRRREAEDEYLVKKRPDGTNAMAHRLVMEGILGRRLRPEETVHHINGMKRDNRPENLELWSSNHPKGQRVSQLVEWAKELLALYEPDTLVD